jgi:4'-phosphopantetheinyl transferase EntD
MPSATELNQILTQTVVALARKPVACAVQSTDDAGGLLPDEEALVAKAVERRRSEFAAGRRSARCALATLGCPVRPLMIGALRQPLWPAGFGGSITHDGRYAAAIAWRVSGHAPDLSLDLIDRADLAVFPTIASAIAHPDEPRWDSEGALARVFSAKETAIKILSPG